MVITSKLWVSQIKYIRITFTITSISDDLDHREHPISLDHGPEWKTKFGNKMSVQETRSARLIRAGFKEIYAWSISLHEQLRDAGHLVIVIRDRIFIAPKDLDAYMSSIRMLTTIIREERERRKEDASNP